MNVRDVLSRLLEYFDDARFLSSEIYEAEVLKKYHHNVKLNYPSLFVVSLSYPKRILKHHEDAFISSNYTFGEDYHLVLKRRMKEAMSSLPFEYQMFVDNHSLDERLAASLSGLGYQGKNQLIITKDYGTYQFLGILSVNHVFDYTSEPVTLDGCGTCRKCIDACPGKALSEEGYIRSNCISSYNQEKISLSLDQIKKNYLLFGCDICQIVCPKNLKIENSKHHDFDFSGKEYVFLDDLVTLSEKSFKQKYNHMAYLWKGKNLLLRNAITLLHNTNRTDKMDLLQQLSLKSYPDYLQSTIRLTIQELEKKIT